MKTDEKLAKELVWAQDGHFSEVAATVAADGQEHLLPADALDHLAACESCVRRVGEAAMLSLRVGDRLVRLARSEAPATVVSAPLPWWAVGLALVLAALGALPALSSAPRRVAQLVDDAMSVSPHLVRALVAIARAGSEAVGPALWVAAASSMVVLLIAGLAIARAVPRSALVRAAQGGGA